MPDFPDIINMIIYIHTFKKVVYNNPWKIENSGIGVFPHYFEFSDLLNKFLF
nr:MAG TPA: hypothetical protein [Herelleviridae sp.]